MCKGLRIKGLLASAGKPKMASYLRHSMSRSQVFTFGNNFIVVGAALKLSLEAPFMIPVVVLGGNLGALGVVRSLAGGGMPIFVADKEAAASRRGHGSLDSSTCADLSGQDLVQGLIHVSIRIGGRPVLIYDDGR